jgi:hypothetical protein
MENLPVNRSSGVIFSVFGNAALTPQEYFAVLYSEVEWVQISWWNQVCEHGMSTKFNRSNCVKFSVFGQF